MGEIGVTKQASVLREKEQFMTTLNSLLTQPTPVNSYLHLFHVAQQNFYLWQQEQKKAEKTRRRLRRNDIC
jgi:hypothetical protein